MKKKLVLVILGWFFAFQTVNARNIEELTANDLKNIFGEEINVNFTLNEYLDYFLKNAPTKTDQYESNAFNQEIKRTLEQKLKENNVEIEKEFQLVVTDPFNNSNPRNDFNKVDITIIVGTNLVFELDGIIDYKKDPGFKEMDRMMIIDEIMQINYDFYKDYHGHTEDKWPYFWVENLGINGNTGKEIILQKINNQLNDSSIKVDYLLLDNTLEEANFKYGKKAFLCFYKDNILYEVRTIFVLNKEKDNEVVNPQTGSFNPYKWLILGCVLIVSIIILAHKNTKFYKI
ncbi:MAG: hypothetical protein HFJ02_06980 [Bacilli bacterium]|nr:hypothetical protein [Bacilli bacterium]